MLQHETNLSSVKKSYQGISLNFKMYVSILFQFLHDIMDALFDMLMEDTRTKQYSYQIFKCMVIIYKSIKDFFRLIPTVYEKKQWPGEFLQKQMLEFVLIEVVDNWFLSLE